MNTALKPLPERTAWKALHAHGAQTKQLHLRELFAMDSKRGVRLTAEAAGLFLDYSKNRMTDQTLRLLGQLAEESGLRGAIEGMFRGDRINLTENRAVLHMALRAPKGSATTVDGKNVVPEVHQVLDKMAAFPTGPERSLERAYRQTSEQCDQYRDRWLGPWPGDGL